MARGVDRLIHLLLRERLGNQAPPDLSLNILNAIDGEKAGRIALAPTPAPQLAVAARARSPWMAVAAGIAICAAIVLSISAWLVTRPTENAPATADGNSVRVIPSEQEAANSERPTPMEPGSDAGADTEPEPEPDLPEQVKQPAPEPARDSIPEAPNPDTDPVVDQPPGTKPEPETPAPREEPPPQPETDPVVNKPEPQPEPQRPPSETQPEKPVRLGTLLYASEKSRLEFRGSDDDKWQAWGEAVPVVSGLQLKARRPVAIELTDGARIYFDGEISLSGDREKLSVTVEDESIYFDVYGSSLEYTVRRGDASLSFSNAEVLAEKSGLRLQVSCLGGEVTDGDVALKAGWTASLSDKGFSREKFQGARVRENPLVASMDKAFALVREELNPDAGNRVYHGEWKDDAVRGAGKELAFGIELSEDVALQARAYLRMRVRINGDGKGLSVGFGSTEQSDRRYFQSHHGEVQPGEWTILRVPLSALMDDGDKKKIWEGVVLHKFQIVLWDKSEATLDVDWFELGIDPEWIQNKEDK